MLSISRPRGSAQFIQIVGTLTTSATPSYGQLPTGFAPGTYNVPFLMALAPQYTQPPGSTGPFDPQYRLPALRFVSYPTLPIDLKEWAQNTDVTIRALNASLTEAELANPNWGFDTNYGAYFVTLAMTVDVALPEIDLQIEVKHSIIR